MNNFCERQFLAELGHYSTSSAVTFSGKVRYDETLYLEHYIEISDCKDKVKLHKTHDETVTEYVEKLTRLQQQLGRFIDFLTAEYLQ